jgi:hypothetical protein
MSELTIRWATSADDAPAEGEALVRLVPVRRRREVVPGAGSPARRLIVNRDKGDTAWGSDDAPTDLHLARVSVQLTVTTADGRQLVARIPPDADAPQVDADADPDLQRAVVRAWRERPPRGRAPEQGQRIAEIVQAAAELGDAATRERTARELCRVIEDGYGGVELPGDYKRDVAAAGGWASIRRAAAKLRRERGL